MRENALSKRDLGLLALLYLFEAALVVTLKAVHMKGERALDAFVFSTTGVVFLSAGTVVLLAGAGLLRLYRAHRRSPSGPFRVVVAMNLVTVFLLLAIGELAVRAGSRSYLDGEAVGTVALKPKSWETTRAHYRDLAEKASGHLSYLVYDNQMGWSVGPNRRSANGLYRSSSNGIRVSQEGRAVSMADEKTTVALVGNSYTFSSEVRYEESWGHHLDQRLGEEVQVLNFGVPGYGVDQAYLRYEKDARRWKPEVTVFGVFSHDLRRTMTVYPFLAHPHWDMPFSKPRFILPDGRLKQLNEPPLPPDAIFSRPSVVELPYLDRDHGYEESDWQQSVYHASDLFRLFVSWFPGWSAEDSDFSDEALVSINAAILKAFVRAALREGTIPVAVYFPGKGDLRRPSSPPTVVQRVLREAGMGYVDPTPCLRKVNPEDRYMPGGHYAPAGNAAVARCLLPVVQGALSQAAARQELAVPESVSPSS